MLESPLKILFPPEPESAESEPFALSERSLFTVSPDVVEVVDADVVEVVVGAVVVVESLSFVPWTSAF